MFKREYLLVYAVVSIIFISYAIITDRMVHRDYDEVRQRVENIRKSNQYLDDVLGHLQQVRVKFFAYKNTDREVYKYQVISEINKLNNTFNLLSGNIADDAGPESLFELHEEIAGIEKLVFSNMAVSMSMMPENFNELQAQDTLHESVGADMLVLFSEEEVDISEEDEEVGTSIQQLDDKTNRILATLEGLYLSNQARIEEIQSDYRPGVDVGITAIWWLILIGMIVFAAIFARKNIEKKLNHFTSTIRKLASGESPEPDEETNDMYDLIIKPSNRLLKYFEDASLFAKKIGDGNFSYELKTLGESDALGNALLQMRDRLQTVANQDRVRNWQNEGQARFVDIVRQSDDFVELGDSLIANLVNYMDATQGVLYTLTEEGDEQFLDILSAYAYSRKKYIKQRIEIGEGLAGQVFLEGKTVHLKEIDGDHFQFQTGLGTSKPQSVLIVPLKEEDKIEGIIEIASLHDIQDYQVEFVEKVGQTMASAIRTAKLNERTRKLLQDAQEKTEQMRAQEEEMRQNMEELQATQEQMERVKQEREEETKKLLKEMKAYQNVYKRILDELPSKIFLKDDECRMIMVNRAVLEAHDQKEEDLIGKNDVDFFGEETGGRLVNEEKEIMRTGRKEFKQREIDSLTDTEKLLHTVKMPFYIDYIGKEGLLGFQFDISAYTEAEKELDGLKKKMGKKK